MKNLIKYAGALMLTAAMSPATFAQTNPSHPQSVEDTVVSNRLSRDFKGRNPNAGNESVEWWDEAYGYNGLYKQDGGEYLSQYDKKGEYVNSYSKKEWKTASPALRAAFDKSAYKGQEVLNYWESSNPARKGSYIQLKDKQGKTSNVWVDDKGKMSAKPSSSNINTAKPGTMAKPK